MKWLIYGGHGWIGGKVIDHGVAIDLKDIPWGGRQLWAPDAAYANGKYYLLVYADSNNQALPPASLTKAILYNCAEDIYNTGIDYKTGYGLLNSYA